MLGLNPSFLWHLIFQLCCIVKLRKVAISKLVWPNNKVNRTSEVCCFVFRLHWAGVLTLEQEVKLNLLMSKNRRAWLASSTRYVSICQTWYLIQLSINAQERQFRMSCHQHSVCTRKLWEEPSFHERLHHL